MADAATTPLSIKWNRDFKRFDDVIIHAELVERADAPIACEIESFALDRENIIVVEHDPDHSEATVPCLKASIHQDLLRDEKFFEKIKQPVRVDVTVKPSGFAASAVVAAPSITRHCFVSIEKPEARIYWQDAALLGSKDPILEVEADGKDTVTLLVSLERWNPAKGVVEVDDTVEFSHMTNSKFPPELFGPDPTDLPEDVAQPGSGNRRTSSMWRSFLPLPDPNRSETLPHEGRIRVRAWEKGDIVWRHSNKLDLAPGAKWIKTVGPAADEEGSVFVPVVLGPSKLTAKLIEPTLPIPADGKPHPIVIEFRRSDGNLVKSGEVSWELVQGTRYPGGSLNPTSLVLTEADAGRARIEYTPPAMRYEPSTAYDQDIDVYSGSGDKRRDAGRVLVYVSPEVRAEILAVKKGLDFEPPYPLTVPADKAPERFVIHVGFQSFEEDVPGEFDVYDAKPGIEVTTASGTCAVTVDQRTDETGKCNWPLPELAPGLASITWQADPRKVIELTPFRQESVGDFDTESVAVVRKYRGVLRDANSQRVLRRLLLQQHLTALGEQPLVQAKHHCKQLEIECNKVRYGTDVVEVVVRSTVTVDDIVVKLFDEALDQIAKVFWDFVDAIFKFMKLGDRIAKWFGSTKAGALMGRALQGLKDKLGAIGDGIRRLSPELGDKLDDLLFALSAGGSRFGEAVSAFTLKVQELMIGLGQRAIDFAEAVALGMLQRRQELIADAVKTGSKKVAEKSIKEISKRLQKYLSGEAGHFDSYIEFKQWLAEGLADMSETAQNVAGTTTTNVAAFSYPYRPGATDQYINEINDLKRERERLELQVAAFDELSDVISKSCDALTVIAIAAAVFSLGTSSIVSFGTVTTAGSVKLAVNSIGHLAQGYQIYALGCVIMETYEVKALALTKNTAGTP